MQNKINSLLFRKNASNTTYYRSIKYRINTTTTLPSEKASTIDYTRTYLKSMNQSMPRKTQYQSTEKIAKFKRYSTIQNQQSYKKQKKMSYLDTWRTLLDKVQFKGIDCKIEPKCETVMLPTIKEFENSQFTILDPINLSIDVVQKELNRANLQLFKAYSEIKSLKSQFHSLKCKVEAQIEESKVGIMEEINKLRQKLCIDSVQQQEIGLRSKRQCKNLKFEQKQFKKAFEQSKQSVSRMQEAIFSTKPFELSKTGKQQFSQQPLYF